MKKAKKDLLGSSPYDFGLSVDMAKKTSKMNEILQEEKRDFMNKLALTRMVRSRLENDSATKIQAAYRGYSIRSNFNNIAAFANVNRMVRLNLRTYLEAVNYPATKLGDYRKFRQQLRHNSAVLIRSAFLRYLSRKYLRRRQFELDLRRRHRSATIIQARIRGAYARTRVLSLIEKRRMVQCILAVLRIQTAVRRMYARRRVRQRRFKLRWIAAKMIQSWYRAKYSRRMAAHIKHILYVRRTHSGALHLQKLVRSFLARRRVNRIRLRRLHVLVFRYVTRIQCLVRRFLARHAVQRKRIAVQSIRLAEAYRLETAAAALAQEKEARENQELLDSADLFLQAQKGQVETVEDIYKGLVGGDPHSPSETDEAGDTLLTLAARLGHMDLLRKTILWGFDVNHRNAQGLSAPLVAARHNHLSLLQYLFTFLPGNNSSGNSDDSTQLILTNSDVGFLFAAAGAHANGSDVTMLQLLVGQQGWDINAKALHTGMTAMHAVCEVGNIEAFKLLWKNKSALDSVDDSGQTPLHKAVTSSLVLSQWILGLDPNFQTFMTDAARRSSILAMDQDGKDCLLLATLAGQNDVLDMLEKVLETTGASSTGPGALRKSMSSLGPMSNGVTPTNAASAATMVNGNNYAEIGWTAQDVAKAVTLVQQGNLYCVRKLVAMFGFDPNWPTEDTGMTMSLMACQQGDIDMIDLLFELGADFSLRDVQGRTVLHFATLLPVATATTVLAHLLTHGSANKCQLRPQLLLLCDSPRGENPCHYAARAGIELTIDLLVGHDVMTAALNAANVDGLTPLLVACSYLREKAIAQLIKLGAEALAVDNLDHGCLWHLYHPHADVSRSRIFAGESPGMVLPVASSGSTHPVYVEIHLVVALMKAGCSLYVNYALPPARILALPDIVHTSGSIHGYDASTEVGDILLQDACVVLLKTLVTTPMLLSPLDAWRLIIGSLRFDSADRSLKLFQVLWKAGLFDILSASAQVLTSVSNSHAEGMSQGTLDDASIESVAAAMASAVQSTASQNSATASQSSAPKARLNRQQSVSGANAANASSIALTMETLQLAKMQDVFFLDMSVAAWALALHHAKALQFLLKRGLNTGLSVDSDGHPALHFVALHGTVELVDILVADKKLRLEQRDRQQCTAAMLAVRADNFSVAKRLFELRASPRKALEGRYAAWVLAFVRRYERNEINTQTGRTGDDDSKYFPVDPDPFYSTWYSL